MSQCIRTRVRPAVGRRRARRRGVAGMVVGIVGVAVGSWACAPGVAGRPAAGPAPVVIGAFSPPAATTASAPAPQVAPTPPTAAAPQPAASAAPPAASPAPASVRDLTLDAPPLPATVVAAPDVPLTAATSSAGALPVSRTVRLSATAYCLRGAMRTGVRTRDGMAAADPRVIPLGSVVRVTHPEGGEVGIFVVMDTGGAIKGNKLDIYMDSCREALRWGRRPVVAEVIDIGQR